MPKCFSRSLLTMGLLFAYLFLLDFVWLILPKVSNGILLAGTLLMLFISFKLATMTSDKIFQVISGA